MLCSKSPFSVPPVAKVRRDRRTVRTRGSQKRQAFLKAVGYNRRAGLHHQYVQIAFACQRGGNAKKEAGHIGRGWDPTVDL